MNHFPFAMATEEKNAHFVPATDLLLITLLDKFMLMLKETEQNNVLQNMNLSCTAVTHQP